MIKLQEFHVWTHVWCNFRGIGTFAFRWKDVKERNFLYIIFHVTATKVTRLICTIHDVVFGIIKLSCHPKTLLLLLICQAQWQVIFLLFKKYIRSNNIWGASGSETSNKIALRYSFLGFPKARLTNLSDVCTFFTMKIF